MLNRLTSRIGSVYTTLYRGLDSDQKEIGYGRSEKARNISREEIDQAVEEMNKQFM
ncbi:hypothetical protein [Peribacillus kribbensis]|uniref:hypothetical protein n=1 Tax=Peribacillus kribbensis TaxID=356658 RepID=UPI00041D96E0|nr:hypothetical protein [Peribacillus kribbensis]